MVRPVDAREESRPPEYNLTRMQEYVVRRVIPTPSAYLRKSSEAHIQARQEALLSPVEGMDKDLGSIEPTSNVDLRVDSHIQSSLMRAFPDIVYLSEDSLKERRDPRLDSTDPEYLKQVPWIWVVDSVDGTGRLLNYSSRFSVSIALVHKGKAVLGVVNEPMKKRTWWAQTDQEGSFINGQPIFVSSTASSPEKAMLSTAYAWDPEKRRKTLDLIGRIAPQLSQILGTASSVLDLGDVARGLTHAHASFGLKPWDQAAQSRLIVNAGGSVMGVTEEPWNVFSDSVLATNKLLDETVVPLIRNAVKAREKEDEAMERRQKGRRLEFSIPLPTRGVIFSAIERIRGKRAA